MVSLIAFDSAACRLALRLTDSQPDKPIVTAAFARGSTRTKRQLSVFLMGLAILLSLALSAEAATQTVTNLNDSGTGSLRATITAAASGDTIVFQTGLTGMLTLASALPTIAKTLTIQGPGPDQITISGNNTVQVFVIGAAGIVDISGLTITEGSATNSAISNGGTLSVTNCTVTGTVTTGNGAGINSSGSGSVTVTNSRFTEKVANGSSGGGAILTTGTSALNVTNSTFSGLTAASNGGAIFLNSNASSTITGSTFIGSTGINGGAINLNQGNLTVVNSTFFNNGTPTNGGGAIRINNTATTVTVTNSTFAGNKAGTNATGNGGAIYDQSGTLSVSNSIFSQNAGVNGGAIYINTGANLSGDSNNVFYGNTGGTNPNANFALAASDAVSPVPLLIPIGNYGGPTQTMLPFPNTLSICGGSAANVPSGVTTDQRGWPLSPANCANGGVDAGAVQSSYFLVTVVSDDGSGTPANCPGANCSLRDAIAAANSTAYGGDIGFAQSLSGQTLTPTFGTLPALNGQDYINIVGVPYPGTASVTLSGDDSIQLLSVASNAKASIYGIALTKGNCNGCSGGAVSSSGTLAVLNTTLTGNVANEGGGIASGAGTTLNVTNSTFSGNSATGSNGGAISANGTATVTNATFSANSATTGQGGGIFSGGTTTVANSAFSANTAGNSGGAIYNSGTANASYNVYYNNLGNGGSVLGCPSCTSDANAVNASESVLAPLASYGGSTQTLLPLPGGAAICAASSTLVPNPITTDQRDFSRFNTTYTGYSAASPCVDAGSVQTNYTAIGFNAASYTTAAGVAITPGPIVSVTENGRNTGAIPITLTFGGSGNATGLGPVTTVSGTGATFSNLIVDTAGSGTLNATLPIVAGTSGFSLNATANLTVTASATTLTATAVPSNTYVYGTAPPAVSVALTLADGGAPINGIAASYFTAVLDGTTNLTVTSSGGNVYAISGISAYLAVGSHSIAITFAGTPSYITSSTTIALAVTQAGISSGASTTLTVAPSTVMYGDTSVLTAAVSPTGATGTVTFTATPTSGGSAITLGTSSVDDTGAAVWPESTLSAGTYNIVAHYNGDPNIAANSSTAVQLTVTKRTGTGGGAALTVIVNDASRTTTQANPPFSYTVAGTLVNRDTSATAVTGTPIYSTSAGNLPGTFAITVAGLTSANYVLAFAPGTLTVVLTPTTTTLSSSPNAPQYGDTVTLTATVTSGATGTVSFYDGSVYLGQGTVSGGMATLSTATLSAGTHSITALYNGDATYASSISSPETVTVAKKTAPGGGPALTVTVLNASRHYGDANPQFVYLVTGTLVNGDSYATAVTGVPVYSVADTPSSPAGSTFPITLSGVVSANYVVSSVPGTLTIVTQPTKTALTAGQTSSTSATQYGDPVTLTAIVSQTGATGFVAFSSGSTVLGTGTVSAGAAALTTSSLPAGSYIITATYLGDGNYGSSTSTPLTLTVAKRTAPGGGPALTITVQNATRAFGQGNPAFSFAVSGTLVNNDTYATAVTGVPVFSTTATIISPVGSYPISLAGLSSNNYEVAFVNGTLTVTKGTPVVTVSSSLNPSVFGTSVTFTAMVSAGTTGTVSFLDGASTLCSNVAISNNTATCSTAALFAGTHSITAQYGGDSNYNSATSAVLLQVVNKASPGGGGKAAVTISSSLNPSVAGAAVTFTATVPTGATGTVTFLDGTTILGTETISGITATLTTSTLAAGTHPITAQYNGDHNFNSAISPVLSQVVTSTSASDFTVTSPTPPQVVPPGASAKFEIDVPSVGAPFTSPVTLTASGLPTGATYTFSPNPVTPGPSGRINSTLIVSVPMPRVRLERDLRTPLAVALLLVPLALLRRARGRPPRLLLWMLLALASFTAITGCGTGGYFSQQQQTYIITVTGTSGSLVRSTTVTLTVE